MGTQKRRFVFVFQCFNVAPFVSPRERHLAPSSVDPLQLFVDFADLSEEG